MGNIAYQDSACPVGTQIPCSPLSPYPGLWNQRSAEGFRTDLLRVPCMAQPDLMTASFSDPLPLPLSFLSHSTIFYQASQADPGNRPCCLLLHALRPWASDGCSFSCLSICISSPLPYSHQDIAPILSYLLSPPLASSLPTTLPPMPSAVRKTFLKGGHDGIISLLQLLLGFL